MAATGKVPQRSVKENTSGFTLLRGKHISWGVFILSWLLVLAIGTAGYFYYELKWASQIEKEKEIADLTETIGEFIELPTDETPTLATVTDREKLADQTFFLKAENGDKVLIYSQSGKAILYRPGTKKVIDMTTVNVNNPAQSEEAAPAPTTSLIMRLALRNGSEEAGLATTVEGKLKAVLPNMAVTSKEDAKNEYTETIVVDITGAHTESAQKIAEELGATVGNAPEGEEVPTDADIMVILGSKSTAAGE